MVESAMEIEGDDGSRTQIREGSEVIFGRGNGFNPKDPTVSRRQISFQLTPTRVTFQVIGKNPIWVRDKESGEIKAFRTSERGQLSVGDLFCVSCRNPLWFSVKNNVGEIEDERDEEFELEGSSESELTGNEQDLDLDLGFDSIDVSNIDPVKEFGFLVIGHEFDNYPKGKIRDVKSWNWFLEDHREASTDDEDETDHDKGKKALSRKRKKKNERDEDDEEWTGESEEEEAITKSRKFHMPKYSTRSKESSTQKGSADNKRSKPADEDEEDEEDDDDDDEEEGDETLGGFLVGDDDVEGEGEDEDENEEDDFEEDEFEE